MPKADKCIKCFRLYSLESFASIDGNIEWIFLKEFPFFFSNKIPICGVLGGGYNEDFNKLVELHSSLHKTCAKFL